MRHPRSDPTHASHASPSRSRWRAGSVLGWAPYPQKRSLAACCSHSTRLNIKVAGDWLRVRSLPAQPSPLLPSKQRLRWTLRGRGITSGGRSEGHETVKPAGPLLCFHPPPTPRYPLPRELRSRDSAYTDSGRWGQIQQRPRKGKIGFRLCKVSSLARTALHVTRRHWYGGN